MEYGIEWKGKERIYTPGKALIALDALSVEYIRLTFVEQLEQLEHTLLGRF